MFPVIRYEVVDSTNLEARRIWEEGRGPDRGFYVVAATQTAGRGRMGREWKSPEGGLWFTLARSVGRDPRRYQGVSLAAGLAVARTLEKELDIRCSVKWPNDLLAGSRKFCGILCEMQFGPPEPLLLVGVGINANFPSALLGEDLLHPAVTLMEVAGREIDIEKLLRALGPELEEVLDRVERGGLGTILPSLRERLAFLGEEVEIHLPRGEKRKGRFAGIDTLGRALLDTATGREAHLSGDLRPAWM